MNVFLAHEDSLKLLRHARRDKSLSLVAAPVSCADPELLHIEAGPLLRALPHGLFRPSRLRPLSVRSLDSARRSQCSVVRASPNLAALPPGAYLEVVRADGGALLADEPGPVRVFVESGGLALLSGARALGRAVRLERMTPRAALIRLVAFGMELCGSYGRDPGMPSAGEVLYDLPPVCMASELGELVDQLAGMHGAPLARRAAGYVNDGSGSAMETFWYLAFCLPPSLGGASFERPLQNVTLEWPPGVRARACHDRLTPDFHWPRYRSVGEYDSELHKSEDAFYEDRDRAKDYGLCDLAYFPITDLDAQSLESMKRLLGQLGARFARYEGPSFARRLEQTMADSEVDSAREVLRSVLLPPQARWRDDRFA